MLGSVGTSVLDTLAVHGYVSAPSSVVLGLLIVYTKKGLKIHVITSKE